MMRSLFSAVSGLKAHQQRMDVIGNNIANVNTAGYKKSRVTFQDMLYQTIRGASRPVAGGLGGTNPIQIGPGVGIGSIDSIMTSTSLQDTGKETDLGINGDGFFCLSDGNSKYFTRAGNFSFDQEGNLTSALNGMKVQGWVAQNGVINTNNAITDINIPTQGVNVSARATSKTVFSGNLSSDSSGQLTFANGTNASSFTVTDSSGASALMRITLTPTNSFNTWNYTITTDTPTASVSNGSGTITFDSSGKVSGSTGTPSVTLSDGTTVDISPPAAGAAINGFTVDTGAGNSISGMEDTVITPKTVRQTVYDSLGTPYTLVTTFTRQTNTTWGWSSEVYKETPTGNVPIALVPGSGSGSITFDATGKYSLSTGSSGISFDPGNGAATVTITPDFSNMTEYASESSAMARSQDGYQEGSLESITFDNSGTIVGVFSNGISQPLAQVALARFANASGLLRDGDSMFSISSNSGEAVLGTAGNNGYGSIKPGSLEASNVDLSSEFTDLIITQRGFEANSKVITATDEMLQDLVNLKR